MVDSTHKFNSMTAYLYNVAFDRSDAEHDEICLDCLNQDNPWQALRVSQKKLDTLIAKVGSMSVKSTRQLDRMKLQLFILSTAEQRMAIHADLNEVVEQLKPIRQQMRSLDSAVSRLKRINHNQRDLLKQLKAGLLGARGEEKQLEVKLKIEEIEWELMSLWQRAIGAELEKLKLMEQDHELKKQAIELLDKQLDRFCYSTEAATAS